MKALWLFGFTLILVLTLGTYTVVGDMIGADIVNILTIVGAGLIVFISVMVVLKYIKQMRDDKANGELANESWDGIHEYKNPLPLGWAISYIILMIFAVWYMTIGYPLESYSQIGEYNKDSKIADDKLAENFAKMTDTEKLHMGEGIFSLHCAPCHGPNGDGQEDYNTGRLTAENLTVREFSKKYVEKVIREGSTQLGYPGGMPPFMLTEDADIESVSAYIANGMKGEAPAMYAVCTSCHGMKGEGMAFVAPALAGFNHDFVKTLLTSGYKKGEIGVMPKLGSVLNETQIDALSSFVEYGTDKEIKKESKD